MLSKVSQIQTRMFSLICKNRHLKNDMNIKKETREEPAGVGRVLETNTIEVCYVHI
jgi:hypothetical protein